MATIKDIARAAGVSQGTVSNVLNGKGNVSSAKIRQVQQAAEQLGYALNQRAQSLRRGSSRQLAVVLPSLFSRTYVDFYTSFHTHAQSQGYQTLLYLTEDLPEREQQAIDEIQSAGVAGVSAFTCLQDGGEAYRLAGVEHMRFVERAPSADTSVLTFDFYQLGRAMATHALQQGAQHMAALTENATFSSQSAFLQGLHSVLGTHTLQEVSTDAIRCNSDFFKILNASPTPDTVFVSNYGIACQLNGLKEHIAPADVRIYGASPLLSMPDHSFTRFELNYRRLGHTCAEQLIAAIGGADMPQGEETLPIDGLRTWMPAVPARAKRLSIITPDSPSSTALKNLAYMYTKTTGVDVRVISCSYEGLDEVLSTVDNTDLFDVIRMDNKRLVYYGERVYEPLENIDPSVPEILSTFFPGLSPTYTHVNGQFCVLPHTPSTQMLFYRRDLFESPAFRRQYQELYGYPLQLPQTYEEYNRIAHFFTRSFNPESPVPYGVGLMLGNVLNAAKEFLTRYFSHSKSLYDANGQILLNTPIGIESMRELVDLRTCVDIAHCSTWRDALRNFADERTAMAILYTNFTNNIISSQSRIADKIGYAMVPGGNPMLGGGVVGVCRSSRNKEEALKFLRWLCSSEVATANTLIGSVSPCLSTYDNYEVMDRYPWLGMAKECFSVSSASHVPPNHDGPFGEPKFLSILGTAVNMAFSGAMSPEDALRLAQTSYEKAFGKP